MQVLIIDNDIAYRNGVSMAASNKHWIPVSCGDIRTAKQIISSTLPDLIISDCLLYAEYRACYRPAVLLLAAFDIYDHSCVTRNITAIQAVRGSCSGWLFNSFLAEQNIIRCMCSCFNVLESTSGKSAAGF